MMTDKIICLNSQNVISKKDFAKMLKIPFKGLMYRIYVNFKNNYTEFTIPKKNGKIRKILSPKKDLKVIQKRLALILNNSYDFENNKISHGFIKKRGIITNAAAHRNKKYVLNIDISNFFESFHFGRVNGFFKKNSNFLLTEEISNLLSNICCHNGRLPQGAPTSPIISNLIFNIVDLKILKIVKKYNLFYTRYADDLTFSTNDPKFLENSNTFLNEITILLEKNGFKINENKTRLSYFYRRQEVTGLTVNKKINVKKEFYKNTKAMAFWLYTKNYFKINGEVGTFNQLDGRFDFLYQLEKFNGLNNKIKNSSKKREMKKFLFYKYFYNPKKPLIVTEGKTDIEHIKSALKNLFQEYPELIEKTYKDNENEGFKNKISFFNKTKKITDILDFPKDGATIFKKIYMYYVGQDGTENLYDYFYKKNKLKNNPVIMIIDNENSKEKPLQNFYNKYFTVEGIKKEDEKNDIKNSEILKVKNNLFLLKIPNSDLSKDIEIEDLYEEKLLNQKNNHRYFEKSKFNDKDLNGYSKVEFAKYVRENYKNINFEKFIPLLDNLKKIILEKKD